MTEFTIAEITCLTENAEISRLMSLMSNPEMATPEEVATIIQCLEHETQLRLFLSGILSVTGPLSEESSACIRNGFADVDLAMITAASSGSANPAEDEGAAMAGMMAGMFVALSCLNEEEWQAAGPAMGMTAEDREGLECLLEEMGGPEGIGALMDSDEGPLGFFGAAIACGMESAMEESGMEESGMEESGAGALAPTSSLAPIDMNDPQALMSQLTAAELSCLLENGDPQQLMLLMTNPEMATPEETTNLIQCLEHENQLRLMLSGILSVTGPLSEESSACISDAFAGVDLAMIMTASSDSENPEEGQEIAMVGMMASMFVTLSCLNEEEWQAAGPAMGMTAEDREGLECLLEEMGGPEGIGRLMDSETGPLAFFGAAIACGVESAGQPPG